MKTYVFLTNSITNMGGAQMLIRNKMLDLESRGWNVQIFYYFPGEKIIIPEFKRFINNRIKELQYPFYAYSQKKRTQVVEKISSIIDCYKNVVVESDFYHLSFWGELIASKVNGINILYFIGEEFPRISKKEELFLCFKQNRKEFVNAHSIKERYSKLVASLHNENEVLKMPSYNNVYSNIEFPLYYDNSFPVITSIGRLEKNYILPMVKSIIEFAENNKTIVNLFFIGDSEYPIFLDEIKNVLSKTSKVIPHFFGYMYPIPLTIINATDVAIATSGSVKVTSSQNIPTISICIEDCFPLGVYGLTTNSCLFRTTEPIVSLSEMLRDILIDGKYKESINYKDSDSSKIYESNSILIKSLLNNSRNYYNCNKIFPIKFQVATRIKRFARYILYNIPLIKKMLYYLKKYNIF